MCLSLHKCIQSLFLFSISGFGVSKRKHFITLFVCLVGWLVVLFLHLYALLMEIFMELYSVDIVDVHWNMLYYYHHCCCCCFIYCLLCCCFVCIHLIVLNSSYCCGPELDDEKFNQTLLSCSLLGRDIPVFYSFDVSNR